MVNKAPWNYPYNDSESDAELQVDLAAVPQYTHQQEYLTAVRF